MKKILFYFLVLMFVFCSKVSAKQERSLFSPQALDEALEVLEQHPQDTNKSTLSKSSSGLEEYWLRIFGLYRHFDKMFPGDKIDGDLKDEIRKKLPRLTPQQVYDQEAYMRFIIKNYRGISKLIQETKAKLLIPEDPPLIVSKEELAPYTHPYIEAKDKVVVIYAPRRILPYIGDKKNFRSVVASMEKYEKKSETQKKIDKLKQQFSQLSLKKVPFYNTVFEDPYSGKQGIGEWASVDRLDARLVSSQLGIKQTKELKTLIQIYPPHGFFIQNDGHHSFAVSTAQSQNVKKLELFRPFPQHFYNKSTQELFSGYEGEVALPLLVVINDEKIPFTLAPEISFNLCSKSDFQCKLVKITPKINLDNLSDEGTSMQNYVEQNFNILPKQSCPKLLLKSADILLTAQNNEYLRFEFIAQKSAKKFEFFLTSPDGMYFNHPVVRVQKDRIFVTLIPKNQTVSLNNKTFELTARLDYKNSFRKSITLQKKGFLSSSSQRITLSNLMLAFIGGFLAFLAPFLFPFTAPYLLKIKNRAIVMKDKRRRQIFLSGMIFAIMSISILLLYAHSHLISLYWGMQWQNRVFPLFMLILTICFFVFFNHWLESQFFKKSINFSPYLFLSGLVIVLLSLAGSVPFIADLFNIYYRNSIYQLGSVLIIFFLGMVTPYVLCRFKITIQFFEGCSKHFKNYLKWYINLSYISLLLWNLYLLGINVSPKLLLYFGLGIALFIALIMFIKLIITEIKKSKEPKEVRDGVTALIQKGSWAIFGGIILTLAFVVALSPAPQVSQDMTFDIEEFEKSQKQNLLDQGNVVLLAIDSQWCVSCLYNRHAILNSYKIKNLENSDKLKIISVDASIPSEKIIKFVEKYGTWDIPFYILYSPKFPQGMILDQNFTASELENIVRSSQF